MKIWVYQKNNYEFETMVMSDAYKKYLDKLTVVVNYK